MNCQYYDTGWETCTNADCPYCADCCPVTENPEVCRYSGLDETEEMLREALDSEVEDSREAIRALAEENDRLRKEIDRLKKGGWISVKDRLPEPPKEE